MSQRVEGRQQEKEQQSYKSIPVAYIPYPSCNWEHQPRYDYSVLLQF